jgi:hypothetical protein
MNKFFVPVIVAAAALATLAGSSFAVVICDCCMSKQTKQCTAACTAVATTPEQCLSVVSYTAITKRSTKNPLNGLSLKEISLGTANAKQLEDWRQFLEKYRHKAIDDYDRADKKYRHGRLSDNAMAAAKAKLREVMVNYNHGIRAYEIAIGLKPE